MIINYSPFTERAIYDLCNYIRMQYWIWHLRRIIFVANIRCLPQGLEMRRYMHSVILLHQTSRNSLLIYQNPFFLQCKHKVFDVIDGRQMRSLYLNLSIGLSFCAFCVHINAKQVELFRVNFILMHDIIIPANFLQTIAKRDFYLSKITHVTRSDMRENILRLTWCLSVLICFEFFP